MVLVIELLSFVVVFFFFSILQFLYFFGEFFFLYLQQCTACLLDKRMLSTIFRRIIESLFSLFFMAWVIITKQKYGLHWELAVKRNS